MSVETEADIVRELRPGMFAWFAKDGVEGFRKVAKTVPWKPEYGTRDWVTVTYADGFVEDRVRFGTHEIWKSGPRPMVGGAR